jgi:hypothetical protein
LDYISQLLDLAYGAAIGAAIGAALGYHVSGCFHQGRSHVAYLWAIALS